MSNFMYTCLHICLFIFLKTTRMFAKTCNNSIVVYYNNICIIHKNSKHHNKILIMCHTISNTQMMWIKLLKFQKKVRLINEICVLSLKLVIKQPNKYRSQNYLSNYISILLNFITNFKQKWTWINKYLPRLI